jgi:UDP-N-acetyl-D-glucosamine dehydrogenase
MESTGLKVGSDIFLVYSPEREDPGNIGYTTQTIPKVVGGHTHACLEVGQAVYQGIIDTIVPVSSTRTAELTKLLENIHRSVNIGLVNEMKIIADMMNIDIHEVVSAAATKPFGFTPYYPGPGLGGHCIPIDPFYLSWKAKEYGINSRFIELAGEVNASMPKWVIDKVVSSLNDKGKPIKESKILVLGLAYKKDIDDMRESPSIDLINILIQKGALIEYSDPHILEFKNSRAINSIMKSVKLTPKKVSQYDAVLLATDHSTFDYQMIKENSKIIIDTRGVYKNQEKNVVKA